VYLSQHLRFLSVLSILCTTLLRPSAKELNTLKLPRSLLNSQRFFVVKILPICLLSVSQRRAHSQSTPSRLLQVYNPTGPSPYPLCKKNKARSAAMARQLDHLLASGWIPPSLSPWASAVLFVRQNPNPITGVRGFQMCLSYVKLNHKTLNRIAYRLPYIADLLDK
jgi:hypothetical protein